MDKKTLEMQIKLLADEAVTQLKTFSEDIKKASAEAKSFTGNAEGINKSIQSLQSELTVHQIHLSYLVVLQQN